MNTLLILNLHSSFVSLVTIIIIVFTVFMVHFFLFVRNYDHRQISNLLQIPVNFVIVLQQREQLLNLKKKLEVDRNKMVESQQNEGPESGGTLSKIGEDEKLCIETLMKDRVFLLQKLEEYEEQVKYHQKEIQRDLDTVEENVKIISQYKEVIGLLKSMLEISKQFPE